MFCSINNSFKTASDIQVHDGIIWYSVAWTGVTLFRTILWVISGALKMHDFIYDYSEDIATFRRPRSPASEMFYHQFFRPTRYQRTLRDWSLWGESTGDPPGFYVTASWSKNQNAQYLSDLRNGQFRAIYVNCKCLCLYLPQFIAWWCGQCCFIFDIQSTNRLIYSTRTWMLQLLVH